MARTAILPSRGTDIEIDIYSNKSSLILFWLLVNHEQVLKVGFAVNELARLTGTSAGLVHKVIKQLEYIGIITSKGLRTNKKFYLKLPGQLLVSWVKKYNLIKKTKTKGFAAFDTNDSKLKLIPALHTASAEYFKSKTTNLRLQEYYFLNWDKLPKTIDQLKLQELDRGYEVLLIKPYYSTLIERLSDNIQRETWMKPYALLTVLDLLHFPVRGVEQAETLFRKTDFIKSICSWNDIENAIG
jgi:hypothetical protein